MGAEPLTENVTVLIENRYACGRESSSREEVPSPQDGQDLRRLEGRSVHGARAAGHSAPRVDEVAGPIPAAALVLAEHVVAVAPRAPETEAGEELSVLAALLGSPHTGRQLLVNVGTLRGAKRPVESPFLLVAGSSG